MSKKSNKTSTTMTYNDSSVTSWMTDTQAFIEELSGITSLANSRRITRLAQILEDDVSYTFTEEDIERFDELVKKYQIKYKSKLTKVLK